MKVLVDTPVWSLSLRRNARALNESERIITMQFEELITEDRVAVVGAIRQEVLSGIREDSVFRKIRDHLQYFRDEVLDSDDYVEAAYVSNQCRRRGIAGAPVDFLLCAVALRRELPIFTTDADFKRYAAVCGVTLYSVN